MNRRANAQDPVDRARTAVARSIRELAKLVGCEDQDVSRRAERALRDIGPYCVGPLAAALAKEPNLRNRLAIIFLLLAFGREAETDVSTALLRASHRDPDPNVRLAAWAAHAQVIADSLPQARTACSRVTDATSTSTERSGESTTGAGAGTTATA